MRRGSILVLALALYATGCGKSAEQSPPPSEAPSAAASDPGVAATLAAPETTAAPMPSTEPAATPSAATSIVPGNVRALGTEPFWNARIEGNSLIYTTPEDQNGRKIAVERRDTAIGAVFSGKLNDQPLRLTLAKRTCSDGMSDRAYPLSAVLSIGSQRRIGCAA